MESVNETFVQVSEREEVLGLQELPEHGGTAQPEILGQTSWISIGFDCTSTIVITSSSFSSF